MVEAVCSRQGGGVLLSVTSRCSPNTEGCVGRTDQVIPRCTGQMQQVPERSGLERPLALVRRGQANPWHISSRAQHPLATSLVSTST